MVRHLANTSGTASIAVVGAESVSGTLLREALAASHVPGSRVNLYGVAGGEAVISEYDGEARLIQEPEIPEIMTHPFIYLCEPGELTERVIEASGPDHTLIDLIGCLPADVPARLVHPGVRPADVEGAPGRPRHLALPHGLSMTLAELLNGIERAVGVEQAAATVLRPASDFGQPGLEELREQTVRLLNFAAVPTETFGSQLAFNTLSATPRDSDGGIDLDARVREETRNLLGWDRQRLALRFLTVPVFYGHGVQVHLRTRSPSTLENLRRTLQASPFFGPPVPPSQATTLAVASESALVVSEPADDGVGGFWIWAVAGEVHSRAAKLAVSLSGQGVPR